MTATVTSDFREEYEAERLRWLRKRFLWYSGIFGALAALNVVVTVLSIPFAPGSLRIPLALAAGIAVIPAAMYIGLFQRVRSAHRLYTRDQLVRFVYWLIVVNGLVQLASAPIGEQAGRAFDASRAEAALVSSESPAPDEPPAVHPDERGDGGETAAGVDDDAPADDGLNIEVTLPHQRVAADGEDQRATLGLGLRWLLTVFISHLLASMFIPWTAREAIRPLIPLLAVHALLVIFIGDESLLVKAGVIAASPLIGVPGVAQSAWRHSRFRDRFHSRVLRRSYRELKRELVDARRIHEGLFPPPVLTGDVRFVYRYEPMRQIGGDFLYAHVFPGVDDESSEPLSVVIIDVTGHGIPAALTVNRLFGELERLFGEDPDIAPGDVLSALNSYVHFTLANHSVYATALCLRVDANLDVLEWASGGHPPAFVRTVDGKIDRLDSTAFVLGACHGADFDPCQRSIPFSPGDTLIAYTDGAIEARDATGSMLGLEGFQRMVAGLRPDPGEENGWASAILRAVDTHRFGPPADDTLIVEIYRPLRAGGPRGHAGGPDRR